MQIENIEIILEILENQKEKEKAIDEELTFIFCELQYNKNDELYKDIKRNLMNFLKLKNIQQLIDAILFMFNIFKKLSKNNYQETKLTNN